MSLSPTQKYNFLVRNVGRWSWRSSPGELTRPDGSTYRPGGVFDMDGISYPGYTFDEAVELAASKLKEERNGRNG